MIRRARNYLILWRDWFLDRPRWYMTSAEFHAAVLGDFVHVSPEMAAKIKAHNPFLARALSDAEHQAAHAELVQPHPVLDNPARSGDDAEEHY